MSAAPPPPSPLLSPDGKHYWDGSRWVPVPTESPQPLVGVEPPRLSKPANNSTVVVIGVIVAVLIVGGLIWYFGYYDTAQSKCERGDLGACVVVAGQQAAIAATTAAALAEAQASASAAAEQQRVDEANRLEAAMVAGCTVVWDPNHNMRVTYIGPNRDANCASAKSQGYTDASRVTGSTIVCADSSLVVEDTGGRVLGADLCQRLHLAIRS